MKGHSDKKQAITHVASLLLYPHLHDSQRQGVCSKDKRAKSAFPLIEIYQNNLWLPFTPSNSENHTLISYYLILSWGLAGK